MKTLPAFRLQRPRSLEAALELLDDLRDDCRVLAGGTDLVVNLRNQSETPKVVLAIGNIAALRGISYDERDGLRVGALATIGEISSSPVIDQLFPVLSKASATISGPTLRAMGTLGGNLCLDTRCHWFNQSFDWRQSCGFCLKKDGDICHVARSSPICVATSCGDLAPALLTLDASVVLRSSTDERIVRLDDFYLDDGTTKFDRRPDELLVEVRVPTSSAALSGFYGKLRVRGAIDYPLAGVAVAGKLTEHGFFEHARLAVTAVAPRPYHVRDAEHFLIGKPANDDTIRQAAEMVYNATTPLKTGGMYSPGYRRLRTRLFARDGLRTIAGLEER
jgi:4-hydroxybenzoyl-CoA reductase subunit beta